MARIVPADEEAIEEAISLLRRGELVCFPTETVYGLGADASDADAVGRIFTAKGRPADHPLIVHLPSARALGEWTAEVPDIAVRLAERFWPGPLTLVLRRGERVPRAVTGGQDTVAVRVPAHPVAGELLRGFRGGIAAPSANRHGRVSPTRAEHAAEELGDAVALVLDGGPTEFGVESTILDLSGGQARLLRPGGVTRSQLAEVLGYRPASPEASAPRAPGTLPSHYAPSTPVRLVPGDRLLSTVAEAAPGELAVIARRDRPAGFEGQWRALPATSRDYARELYAALREADAAGAREIAVESPPEAEEWEAVHDRLRRSAAGGPR